MSNSTSDELTGDEGNPEVHGNGAATNDRPAANGDASEYSTLRGLRENARVAMDALRDAGGAPQPPSPNWAVAPQAGARTSAQIARQVEAQPMTSVIVAASLGLIAGGLLGTPLTGTRQIERG